MVSKIKITIAIILFFTCNITFAQQNCNNKFDSISVIKYVQQKGLLLLPSGHILEEAMKYPAMAPSALFDENKCQWTVISKTYKHSMKGDCKKTNGCTIEVYQTVRITASDKNILSKKRAYKKFNNYEK